MQKLKPLEKKVYETAKEHGMLSGGVLLGLSGGSDSVCLLFCLLAIKKEKDFPLYAAHINHCLRGSEADRDEEFCRSLCERLNVPFFSKKADVKQYAAKEKKSIEEAAREVRYSFFSEILSENRELKHIATAHNAKDNIETALFRLCRGTGLDGMCGIPPVRGNIIRPLLYITKEEILCYLKDGGIAFVEDSTNLSDDYARNKIRLSVIPKLSELYGDISLSFAKTAKMLSEDRDFLHNEAKRIYSSLSRPLRVSETEKLHKALLSRILILYYKDETKKDISPEHIHIETALSLIKRGGDFLCDFPLGYVLKRKGDILSFSLKNEKKDKISYHIPAAIGENIIPNTNFSLFLLKSREEAEEVKKNGENIYKLFIYTAASGDIINSDLAIRQRKEGDKILFGGMKRRLKTLFSDRHIDSDIRNTLPLLVRETDEGEEILYIPHFPVSDCIKDKEQENNIYICFAEKK